MFDNVAKKLIIIRERYYRNKKITHHGDCSIYRAITSCSSLKACTCGLLHDLDVLNTSLIEKIYPKYFKERAMQELGIYWNESEYKEDNKELDVLLEEAGFKITETDINQEKIDWQSIRNVFGDKFYVKCLAEFYLPEYYI